MRRRDYPSFSADRFKFVTPAKAGAQDTYVLGHSANVFACGVHVRLPILPAAWGTGSRPSPDDGHNERRRLGNQVSASRALRPPRLDEAT